MNEPSPSPTLSATSDASPPAEPIGEGDPAQFSRGSLVGRYVVLQPVGRGAMGVVYAAYDPELDRRVALKLVAPERRDGSERHALRMLREAQAMARVDHPNVVSVHDVGTIVDAIYIAMEFIDGETLRDWAVGKPWTRVVDVCLRVGRGLHAAHEAGLVHRDFKPENVLVDGNERPRVLDFGLARPADDDDVATSEHAARFADGRSPLGLSVTVRGTAIGTPAYMPPEQYAGEPADPRADQFSFCVVVWELLYGRRPYGGRDLATRQENIAARNIEEPARTPRVPVALKQALLRGLDPDAERRFGSMAPVLDAMQRAIRPRAGGRTLVLGVVGLAAGAAGLWAFLPPADEPCEGAEELVGPAWEGRRTRIRAAFDGSGAPAPEETFTRVDARVSAYLDAWVDAHRAVCEATLVHKTQTSSMHDLRMRCLEDRRRAVTALGDLLETAKADDLRRAVRAADRLPPLARCDDTRALQMLIPPPDDPGVAAEVQAIEAELQGLWAATNLGRGEETEPKAAALLERARATDHPPVIARALRTLADAVSARSDYQRARELYGEAIVAASSTGDTDLLAYLWPVMIWVTDIGGDDERARELLLAADAAVNAPGVEAYRRGMLDVYASNVFMSLGDLQQAEDRARRGLASFDEGNPNHEHRSHALRTMGNILSKRGEFDEAEGFLREAAEWAETNYGRVHPDVGAARAQLGAALIRAHRPEKALAEYDEALAVFEQTFGRQHPHTATVLLNRGVAMLELRRFEEALGALRAAQAVFAEKFGPDDARTLAADGGITTALARTGHLQEARDLQAEVVRRLEARSPAPTETLSIELDSLGDMEGKLGNDLGALKIFERSLEVRTSVFPDKPAKRAKTLLLLALTKAALGRHRDAKADLEVVLETLDPDDEELAVEANFGLAKSLHALGIDLDRVDRLLQTAIDLTPERQQSRVDEIRAWRSASLQ